MRLYVQRPVIIGECWRDLVGVSMGTDALVAYVKDALSDRPNALDQQAIKAEQFRFAQMVARELHAYEERLKVDLQAVMDAAAQDAQAAEDAHRDRMAALEYRPEYDKVAGAEVPPREPVTP